MVDSDRQTLVSVHITGLPDGETITDGNGHVYTGGNIRILAADFRTGLTLSGNPPSAGTLHISATVLGPAGPVESVPVDMPLTLDLSGAVHWINSAGGDWNDAGSWSTGSVPIQFEDVIIDAAGTYVVTSSGNVSVDSVKVGSGATLKITGGSISLTTANTDPLSNAGTILVGATATLIVGESGFPNTATNAGTLEAAGGTINLVNMTVANSGTLQANSGTINLVNVTVANSGTVQVDLNGTLNLQTAIINGGTVTNAGLLETIGGTSSIIENATSFINSGNLVATGGNFLALISETVTNSGTVQVNGVLDLQNAVIDSGNLTNAGLLVASGHLSSTISNIASGHFINSGELLVTDSNTTLVLINETVANSGTVQVDSNATINLQTAPSLTAAR